MERGDEWSTLLSVAGAAGGAVAVVYAAGFEVLRLRYNGFGLSGQDAMAATPREQILVRGGVALVLWTVLGFVVALLIWAARRGAGAVNKQAWGQPGRGLVAASLGVVAALALVLFMLLHVAWPLFALGAVVVFVIAAARLRSRPATRFLVCAVAVAVVARSYEADRLTFIVQRTCVDLASPEATSCGMLVGQTDRGIYLGRVMTGRSDLVFLPASRIEAAATWPERVEVIPSAARARREPLLSRIFNLDIR